MPSCQYLRLSNSPQMMPPKARYGSFLEDIYNTRLCTIGCIKKQPYIESYASIIK